MPVLRWFRQARHLAALFMIAAVLPVAVLSWLGLRLMQQDRDLEGQRIQQRLEDAADRVTAEFEAYLTRIEAKLPEMAAAPPTELPPGAVFAVFTRSAVDAWPQGRLLYYPVAMTAEHAGDEVFWPGERLEFQDGAYDRAAAMFRQLAQSKDVRIRAGALIRLARNLRRLKQHEAVLSAYGQLESLGDVTAGGVPAGLLGRHARCSDLQELGRLEELRREAEPLCRDLRKGRWRLDRASYEFYAKDVRRWLVGSCEPGENRVSAALAAAVVSLWEQWQSGARAEAAASGRRTLWLHGTSLLAVSQNSPDRFLSMVAAPSYLESEWRDVWEDRRLLVRLADSNGRLVAGRIMDLPEPRVVRTSAETRLPWTLYVANANPGADASALAGRRRLFVAGLAVMAIALIAAGYMTGRAAARELAAARLQSDFVSAVSHEFRSPLTSMRHLTELLEDSRVIDQDRQRQYYRMLAKETRRLHRLVEGLLNFGRMEAGVMQYRPEKLDPGVLVGEVVTEYREENPPSGPRISVDADSSLASISADAEALRSAVWNLLDNAAKYSPADSAIDVTVANEPGLVAIRVRDHGPGIPAAEQERIFERFYRAVSSQSSGVKGTGLGLALVRNIVAAHNGEVRLESAPGEGSAFTITLPAVEEG